MTSLYDYIQKMGTGNGNFPDTLEAVGDICLHLLFKSSTYLNLTTVYSSIRAKQLHFHMNSISVISLLHS